MIGMGEMNIPLPNKDHVSYEEYELLAKQQVANRLAKHYGVGPEEFGLEDVDKYLDVSRQGVSATTSVGGYIGYAFNNLLSSTQRVANIMTFGIPKNIIDDTHRNQVIDKHRGLQPWSETNGFWNTVARTIYGTAEAGTGAAKYAGPSAGFAKLKLTGYTPKVAQAIRSALTFGSVGATERITDPHMREQQSLKTWLVGSSLDTILGSVFPMMGRLGGETLLAKNNYVALAQFLGQTTAISTAMTATQYADEMYKWHEENPNKTFKDAMIATYDNVIDGEQLFQTFITMGMLHGHSAYPRFLKSGNKNAELYKELMEHTQDMWKKALWD